MSELFQRAAEARVSLEESRRAAREERDRQLRLLFNSLVSHRDELRQYRTGFEWGGDQGARRELCIFLHLHGGEGKMNVITYDEDHFVAHGSGMWDGDDCLIPSTWDLGDDADAAMESIIRWIVTHDRLPAYGSYPVTWVGYKPLSAMPIEISARTYLAVSATIIIVVVAIGAM